MKIAKGRPIKYHPKKIFGLVQILSSRDIMQNVPNFLSVLFHVLLAGQ